MKVLLVGSGGREHALAWRLARSGPHVEIHAAPGNPGIAGIGHCHPVRSDDLEGLLDSNPHLVYRVMRAIVRVVHELQRRLSMQTAELTNYLYKTHGRY